MLGVVLAMSLVCVVGTGRADTTNLIPNGDFTIDASGWTWTGGTGSWLDATVSTSPDGPSASLDGHQWFYRPTANTTPPLIEGQAYRASFLGKLLVDDGNLGDARLYMETKHGGVSHGFVPTLDGTWRTYSYEFTATAADAANSYAVGFLSGISLESGFEYAGATGGSTFGIDSVALRAVPEPTTIVLLGTGLLGLLAYAWRKRKCVPS
jgi:hypothetical protein